LTDDPGKSAWFCQADRIDETGEPVPGYLPLFSRMASTGNKRRDVARFLMAPERGKAFLFYSLFRRGALPGAADVLRAVPNMRGADHIFIYAFICRHDIAIDGALLFHKRQQSKPPRQRGVRLLSGKHFKGHYLAAKGTPYEALTMLLLLPKFVWDRLHRLYHPRRQAYRRGKGAVQSPLAR
jgi:hypothetical protein